MQFGGLFKNLAKHGKKITNFHSFHHRDANHSSAQHWVMTGEANFGAGTTQTWPSYGSIASAFHGTNAPNGLPTYIKMSSLQHDDAAWMGGKYTGYDATREGRKDLRLLGSDQKFQRRLKMLSIMEHNYKAKDQQIAKSWNDLKEQAVNVILGEASKAFKIEGDKEYDDYKDNNFGKDMITAVRLIEAGSKFVTLNYGGWDMHGNIAGSIKSQAPSLDQAFAALISDLDERGMLDETLVMITSEFSRTPKINTSAGRDHWPKVMSVVMAGGGMKRGYIHGTSDPTGSEPDENPVSVPDWAATVWTLMGIDPLRRLAGPGNRPMPINYDGVVLKDALA